MLGDTVFVWDRATGQLLHNLNPGGVYDLSFSEDGQTLYATNVDNRVVAWDVTSGKVVSESQYELSVSTAKLSQHGQMVIEIDDTIHLRDMATGTVLGSYRGVGSARDAAVSPDGSQLMAGGCGAGLNNQCTEGEIVIWDTATQEVIRSVTGHRDTVTQVTFSPDGDFIVSGTADGSLILWNLDGEALRTFSGNSESISSIAFRQDGSLFLSGSADGMLILWDVGSGRQVATLAGHRDAVSSIAFAPDGQTALSGSTEIIERDLKQGEVITTFPNHMDFIPYRPQVAMSPDGQTALSTSCGYVDRAARCVEDLVLWDFITGDRALTLGGRIGMITSVAFGPDRSTAFAGGCTSGIDCREGVVIDWDLVTGAQHTWNLQSPVTSVAVSADGQYVLSGSQDGTVTLWDATNGTAVQSFITNQKPVMSIGFSPDGQTFLVARCASDPSNAPLSTENCSEGELNLWDTSTGEVLKTFGSVSATRVAFSPDGKTALVNSKDNLLTLFDIETGQLLRSFSGHGAPSNSIAFSPSGRLIASGGEDQNIIVWDAATGEVLRTFKDTAPITGIAFTPDGKAIFSDSSDGIPALRRMDNLEELVAWIHANRYIRELTCTEREQFQVTPLC